MSYLGRLTYIALGGGQNWPQRIGAVIALLADTVTTLYALYVSPLPLRETNLFGSALLEIGGYGEVLFLAVPLFNLLLLLYLPGLLGDAVAVSNLLIHGIAAAINAVNLMGMAVPVDTVYPVAIAAASVAGVAVQYPALRRRDRTYVSSSAAQQA